MASLGVNIDHIANIREARRTIEPDPVSMGCSTTSSLSSSPPLREADVTDEHLEH